MTKKKSPTKKKSTKRAAKKRAAAPAPAYVDPPVLPVPRRTTGYTGLTRKEAVTGVPKARAAEQ